MKIFNYKYSYSDGDKLTFLFGKVLDCVQVEPDAMTDLITTVDIGLMKIYSIEKVFVIPLSEEQIFEKLKIVDHDFYNALMIYDTVVKNVVKPVEEFDVNRDLNLEITKTLGEEKMGDYMKPEVFAELKNITSVATSKSTNKNPEALDVIETLVDIVDKQIPKNIKTKVAVQEL